MAAQQDNGNDDDDVPVKYQPPKDRAAKKAESQAKLHELLGIVGDKLSDVGGAVGDWLGKHGQGNAGGAMSDAPAVSDDDKADDPPIQYTHSGDAADMGPPATLKQPTTDGTFRPTPSGTDSDRGPPATAAGLPEKAEGDNYERVRDAIKGVESSGRYDAVNKDPNNPKDKGALGAYQFRPGQWDSWVQQNFNHSVQDMTPQKGDGPDEVKRKEQEQDKVFAKYYEDQMVPWIKGVRADGLGKDKSDVELAALFHNQGGPKAEEILQGKAPEPKDYVQQVAAAAGVKGQVQWGNSMAGRGTTPSSIANSVNDSGKSIDTLGGVDLSGVRSYLPDVKDPNIQETAYGLKKAIASGDDDDFTKELDKLRQDYKDEKDTIAKRELAHTIADALTKMGAGAMGVRTKVDMSHINIGDHDFQKDTALAQNEYKTNLDDLKGRREEDMKKRESVADALFKQQALDLDTSKYKTTVATDQARLGIEQNKALHEASNQDAMTQYHLAAADAMNENKLEDRERKMQQAHDVLVQRQSDTLARLSANKELAKDPDRFGAAAMAALAPFNLPKNIVHKAVYEPGMLWGENVQSPDKVAENFNQLIHEYGSRPQSIQVNYTNEQGKPGTRAFTDPAQANEFRAGVKKLGGQVSG